MKKGLLIGLISSIGVTSAFATGMYFSHKSIEAKLNAKPSVSVEDSESKKEKLEAKTESDSKDSKENSKSKEKREDTVEKSKDTTTVTKEEKPVAKKETQTKANLIKFDGNKIDVSGFKELKRQEIDFNGDKVKDIVVEYMNTTNPIDFIERTSVVVIYDGATKNVLTSFNLQGLPLAIKSISDFTGDGVYDFLIDTHTGGQRGSGNILMHYENGGYIDTPSKENDWIDLEFKEGFKIVGTHKNSGKTKEFTITDSNKKQEYIDGGLFSSDGKMLKDSSSSDYGISSKGHDGYFSDYDKDGTFEFVNKSFEGIYALYAGEVAVEVFTAYEFKNGQSELADFWFK